MKIQKEDKPLWLLMVVCLSIIISLGLILILNFGDEPWLSTAGYLVAASAIAIGGCVAYRHLRIIQGTERAEVLTSLDCSWMSNEMEISRTSFLKFQKEFKAIEDSTKRQAYIKKKLYKIRNNDEGLYRKLMAMINFFEGVGYFSSVGYILPNDALKLYGPAIRENDMAFRSHILELQKENEDEEIYANFLWLADKAKL